MSLGIGLLATPLAGFASAALMLGETITLPLILAAIMILSGIAIGTISSARARNN